jgi:hypothetical protein
VSARPCNYDLGGLAGRAILAQDAVSGKGLRGSES